MTTLHFDFWRSLYQNEIQGLYGIYLNELKQIKPYSKTLSLSQFTLIAYQHSSKRIPYYEIEHCSF